jgi:hypothetical protein
VTAVSNAGIQVNWVITRRTFASLLSTLVYSHTRMPSSDIAITKTHLPRRIDNVAHSRWALSRWISFHSVAFPFPRPQRSGAHLSRLGTRIPKSSFDQMTDNRTNTHRAPGYCYPASWLCKSVSLKCRTNLMKHSIPRQRSPSQQSTDCCWEYAATSMSGVIVAGKLYLPMGSPPALATLEAVREAAKVAYNRELSWDPFNLRIAITPVKAN